MLEPDVCRAGAVFEAIRDQLAQQLQRRQRRVGDHRVVQLVEAGERRLVLPGQRELARCVEVGRALQALPEPARRVCGV